MRVKAVLFDLFNTLVLIESDDVFYMPSLRKLHEVLVRNGVEVSFEEFCRVYFAVRDRLYAESEKSLDEPHFNVRVSLTLQELGYDLHVSDPIVVRATKAFADELICYVHPDENASDVLQKLQGKYKLGVVSNFALPEVALKLLDQFGLKRFLEVVLISGDVNRRKPSPEIFEKALKALGVEASQAVFVGDTPNLDVKGARNAGIKSVLLAREAPSTDAGSYVWKSSDATTHFEPDMVIKNLGELLAVLEDCERQDDNAY